MSSDLYLRPETFWHLTSPSGLLLHNVRVGKGWTLSVSRVIEIEGNGGFATPYSLLHVDHEKEKAWEDVRAASFPHCPSRLNSFYAFTAKQDAETALTSWFAGEQKIIVAVRTLSSSVLHLADAAHLDSHPHEWLDKATSYWSGIFTENPRREALLHGALYFPDWRDPTFDPQWSPTQ